MLAIKKCILTMSWIGNNVLWDSLMDDFVTKCRVERFCQMQKNYVLNLCHYLNTFFESQSFTGYKTVKFEKSSVIFNQINEK